ncbi:MAG: gluconokinase [Flavobacteriaceae bacterium]|nr:gluconokinase [Flavobacteriaceae bacterium]
MSRIIIVMGVSGSGKTTLGNAIAKKFNYVFLEGDAFHSELNKEKMKKGIPLTDQDRLPWLIKINQTLQSKKGVKIVLACSALKENYRELLQQKLAQKTVLWVYLKSEFSVLKKRMENRDHFMPVSLLKSQLETLEAPKKAITIDSSLSIEKMIYQLKPHLYE